MTAQTLLHIICKKRKRYAAENDGIPYAGNSSYKYCNYSSFLFCLLRFVRFWRQNDGALHMVGSLADILLNKPLCKSQMEQLLAFNEETILSEAISLTQGALLTDSELHVKVL